MTTSPRPTAVRFDDDSFWVELEDGRVMGVPLAWFPRLMHASPELLAGVELSPSGLHWDVLDEDISIAGLLGWVIERGRHRKRRRRGTGKPVTPILTCGQ
jgi:hypothetical protein